MNQVNRDSALEFQEELQIERRGALGVVTLNRPQALNALSLEMIRELSAALRRWETDSLVTAIFIKGGGGRAFCAGGDAKAFYKAGMDYRRGNVGAKVPAVYFAEEYSLNKQIFHYSKPLVSFMNGITMGGGYGVAGNCRIRVATENTIFAMPETRIGFFPDVGSAYHLLRAPHYIGWYLALTGNSIGAADVLAARLAEYFVPLKQEETFIKKLALGEDPATVLQSLHREPVGDTLPAKQIEKIFKHEQLPKILKALERDGSDWALTVLAELQKRSPLSIMVTAEHLRRSKKRSFDRIIETDFILAQRFIQGFDMYEGIRAALIDKDQSPRWEPPRFEEISKKAVKEYFRSTGYDLGDIQIFTA